MEYTLSLAVVDFLPVLFAGIGFSYIIRLVSFILPAQGRIIFWGSVLVLTGGLSRALWKLLMAFSQGAMNLPWLENTLFLFMAPGYILLAWSLWQTARAAQGKRVFQGWSASFGIIAFMFLASFYFLQTNAGSPAWERVLLSMMVLASLVTGILLIAFAFRLKLFLAGVLFLVNLVIIFILNDMARLPELPISLQWIVEIINSVAWLAFALGARLLFDARSNFTIVSSLTPPLSLTIK